MSDSKKDKKEVSVNTQDEINFRSVFSAFLKNEHHTFVIQKTEKLASALYMVTGFIPNEDPLKGRLRTCALDLISTSADPEKARAMRFHEGFASRCLEIGSILNLAQRAGLVSPMNVRILCDEYAELASFVKTHQDRVFGGGEVNVQGTHRPEPIADVVHVPKKIEEFQKDSSKGHEIKKTNNYKRHLNRKDMILNLLDTKEKITVKDAVKAIEGCSEKTIQRELISLVTEGVLLKEGERRWSTYRKAKP